MQIFKFLTKMDTRNESNDVRKKSKQRKWRHFLSCGLILLLNAHAPSAVLAFTCRMAKTFRKHYVWRLFFWKRREKNSFSNEIGYAGTGTQSRNLSLISMLLNLTRGRKTFKARTGPIYKIIFKFERILQKRDVKWRLKRSFYTGEFFEKMKQCIAKYCRLICCFCDNDRKTIKIRKAIVEVLGILERLYFLCCSFPFGGWDGFVLYIGIFPPKV